MSNAVYGLPKASEPYAGFATVRGAEGIWPYARFRETFNTEDVLGLFTAEDTDTALLE